MIGNVAEYAALAVVYSLLAAAVLETLLYFWRVQDPPLAMSFRLAILVIPPVAPLLFDAIAPEALRRRVALLDLGNWLGPELSLYHPGWLLLLTVMAATTVLLAGMEVAALLRRSTSPRARVKDVLPLPNRLQRALAGLVASGMRPCPVLVTEQAEPTACTTGLRRPTIVVTTGLLALLDDEELETVLAHEMAHVERQDNGLGWALFGLRLISFYNPVSLFVFHQVSHDTERICDARAAAATGKQLALASALIKVFRTTHARAGEGQEEWRLGAGRATALENRARRALVLDRAERLVHPEEVNSVSYPALRLGLAVVGVLGLAYLVV